MTITIGALTIGHRRRDAAAATPAAAPASGPEALAGRSTRTGERRPSPEGRPGLRATWLLVRQADGSVRPEMSWADRSR